jgi:hypothetical protein
MRPMLSSPQQGLRQSSISAIVLSESMRIPFTGAGSFPLKACVSSQFASGLWWSAAIVGLMFEFSMANAAAPTLIIKSPKPDAIIVSGSSVTVSAELLGDFTKVWGLELYEKRDCYDCYSTRIGGFTDPPYQTNWLAKGYGDFSITALANVEHSNVLSGVGSLPVTVHIVPEAGFPVIIRSPQQQTCSRGGNVTLTVEADGQAPLNYQWRFDGNSITGATHPTLSITNVQPETAGLYTVVVQNRLGTVASSPAFLALNYTNAGWVVLQNLNATLRAPVRDPFTGRLLSGSWHMELRAGSRPDQLFPTSGPKLVWFDSGYFVAGTTTIPTVPAGGTACVQVLIWDAFPSTFEEAVANGRFWEVSNRFPVTPSLANSTNPPAWLDKLQFPADIRWPPEYPVVSNRTNQVAVLGSDVTLRANISSFAIPHWRWRKDGRDIPFAGSSSTNFFFGISAALTLTQVSLADAGNYSLLVTNESVNHTFISPNISLAVVIPAGGYLSPSQLLNDGGFELRLLGRVGSRHTIQASSDGSAWTPLITITNSVGSVEWIDTAAKDLGWRFYRAILEP